MTAPPEQVVSEVGKRLSQARLNKDSLVKLLKKATVALSELRQSSSLKNALAPLSSSLVQNNILQHKDKDVRLLIAVCFTEIIRILAPNQPFEDEVFKDVFKLIVSIFVDLDDIASPYFTRRVKILETISALRCCVLMLDIGCDSLVLQMFNTFFSVVREDHQESLTRAMLSIMKQILEDSVSIPLVDIILRNLLKDEKGVSSASFKLAVSVIQNLVEKLEPFVRDFLISCILERDTTGSELKESYHEVIFVIFQCAPQMLISVVPNLTQELIADQVDVRMKAVHLVGQLFVQSKLRAVLEYRSLFVEFIKRFSDKSTEVRIRVLECAKACYLSNTSATAALEILTALEDRLLDTDDKVRSQAVIAVCDMATCHLGSFPSTLVLQAAERLRDKKVTVRRKTMHKLLELYRAYCSKCSEGLMPVSDHYEQIPSRILTLCFDKDCKDFRPQNMELVLVDNLFPATLSIEERANHWAAIFSFFSLHHTRALSSILSQKRRLQMEMQVYINLREKEKEDFSEEVQQKVSASLANMAAFFLDSSKAQECFQKLHQMKDNHIFKALLDLIDERTTFATAQSIHDSFLRRIGEKHPNHDFFRTLSLKCSHSIFTAEHVQYFLKSLLFRKSEENTSLGTCSFDLLNTVVSIFPSLLRGSEEIFLKLFTKGTSLSNEKLLQMLSSVGRHISVNLRDIFSFLEQICLEGTRSQSKYAVSSIASLADASEQSVFTDLLKELEGFLRRGKNLPTVLQSLGCIAIQSPSAFGSLEARIRESIFEKCFSSMRGQSLCKKAKPNRTSTQSASCALKVYGLKALLKMFLACQGTHTRDEIMDFLNILSRILQGSDVLEDIILSDNHWNHLRLTAAKSVIHLSSKWDLHISPQLFHLTVLTAKDSSSTVCKSFLCKAYKLLKERAIPTRYSCAFALAASDCHRELQLESEKYLAEFIKEYDNSSRIQQSVLEGDDGGAAMSHPVYIVVFLIHILAHDQRFPPEDCEDEDVYACFCWPLLTFLRAILSPLPDDSKRDISQPISYLVRIFRAIKKSEDAVDACVTPKLHLLSHIGLLAVKKMFNDFKPSSNGPRVVLLPSSYYKIAQNVRNDEVHLNTERFICEAFIERMLKFSPRNQGESEKKLLDVKKSMMKRLAQDNQPALNGGKTKAEQDNGTGEGPQQMPSLRFTSVGKNEQVLSSSISVELLSECSDINKNKNGATREDVVIEGLEQMQSSCGSAIMKPSSLDLKVSTNEIEMINCFPQMTSNTKITTRRTPFEPIENCKYKNLTGSKALIGHRISLWSPLDKCFYSGTVMDYDSQSSTHKVIYDRGDVELVRLHNGRWEVISKRSVDKDETKLPGKDGVETSDTSFEDLSSIFRDTVTQHDDKGKRNIKKNRPSTSVTGNRRSKRLKPSSSVN